MNKRIMFLLSFALTLGLLCNGHAAGKTVLYDFESGAQGWGGLKDGTDPTVVAETHADGGSQSLRVTIDEGAHGQQEGGWSSPRDFTAAEADVSAGGHTTLSFWYRVDDPDLNGGNFVVHWIMSTQGWSGGGWYGNGLWGVLIADGQWRRQTVDLSILGADAGGWEGTWGDQTAWRFGDDLLYSFEIAVASTDNTNGSNIYIDDIQISGAEEPPTAETTVIYDFETGTQGWGGLKDGTDPTISPETHSVGGGQSLRVTVDEGAHGQQEGGWSSPRDFTAAEADVSAGGHTTLSFWYRVDDSDLNGGNFIVHWIMSGGGGGGWYGNGAWGAVIADGQWHQQMFDLSILGANAGGWEGTWGDQTEWRFGDDLLYNIEIAVAATDNTNGSHIYIDDVQISGAAEPPAPDKLVVYDFETDTQGWGGLKDGTDPTVAVETHADGGSQSLRVTIDEGAHEQQEGGWSSPRDFTVAEAEVSAGGYTDLSFWYRVDDPDLDGGNFIVHWIMSTEFWSGGGWYGNGSWGALIADGQWHKQMFKLASLGADAGGWEGTWGDQTEWRFADDLFYNIEIAVSPTDNTAGSFIYIDDVQLSGGSLIPNPIPAKGDSDIAINTVLSWGSPDSTSTFNVYLGTSLDSVKNADLDSDPNVIFAAVDVNNFDPGALEFRTDYFWRVDLVTEANPASPVKGSVWSFATGNSVIIDDFESYNDINPGEPGSNTIFEAWIDGFGDAANGSLVAYNFPPYAEQSLVHGGAQSMPFLYDNTAAIVSSEAHRVWPEPQIWTDGTDTNVAGLYVYGSIQNRPGELYVIIEDNAGASHSVVIGGSNVFTTEQWTELDLQLDTFAAAGVNLAAVVKMTIGVSDIPGQPEANGLIMIDDIKRYPEIPLVLEPDHLVVPNTGIMRNNVIGFEVQINDNDSAGGRETMLRWYSDDNDSWQNPSLFG